MNSLTPYRASDRRCYNGAPCSDLLREINTTKELESLMKSLDSTAHCTYFPVEGAYMVFYYPQPYKTQELTGNFHQDKQEALIEAIQSLRSK